MANQLSTEQLLLINNLMYMSNDAPLVSMVNGTEGKTIGDIVSGIDVNQLKNTQSNELTSGDDWAKIIEAVKSDSQLMNMEVVTTHQDASGGKSLLLANPDTNEAVVVFRGTGKNEWKDNFEGGGPTNGSDGVSTQQQENTLDWYESLELDGYDTITVTGHSKGGNKAKYVTVMDDSVDRCVSFDGQGFSDEFCEKYEAKIACNQGKIENHNAESDYVNLLLNDIGKTTYYKGENYNTDLAFVENHCADTMLHFNEDGSVSMTEGTRDSRMVIIDDFLNSYLRTLSPEEKQKVLSLIGELVEAGFNKASVQELLDTFLNGDNTEAAADLLAYLLVYKEENPEFVDAIQDILNGMGMENVSDLIDTVVDVTEWEYFDTVAAYLSKAGGNLPDWILNEIGKKIKKETGLDLSADDLRKLLGMVNSAANKMDDVEIKSGRDKKIITVDASVGKNPFLTRLNQMHIRKNELAACASRLDSIGDEILAVTRGLDGSLIPARIKLYALAGKVEVQARKCKKLGKKLEEICNIYNETENAIIAAAKK